MKGLGSVLRIRGSLQAKQALVRKLLPLENVAHKYSATVNTQLNLPFTSDLSIPMSVERMRHAYDGKLGDVEIRAVQPIMLNAVASIKHAMYTKQPCSLIAHSSKVVSPFLWDVVMVWLRRCGFTIVEDIREVVLVEDCQNQGRTRVKLLFGAEIYWKRDALEQVQLLKSLEEMPAYEEKIG